MLVVSCGGDNSGETRESEVRNARQDSVFDPMVGTMDRARTVDQLSADRKDELDQQIGQSE